MMNGRLFLIPTPLGDYPPNKVLPAPVLDLIPTIRLWFVEELRTARRFLSAAGWKGHVEDLELLEINEHTSREQIEAYALRLGTEDAGLISEAGLPAVADPGAQLVALAHGRGVEVVPQVGPSSLMLALMASGLNGQSFAFVGYVPAKTEERRAALRRLEKRSAAERQTQILIETPYRNDSLFADLLATLGGKTLVTVAANITQPDAFIRTQSVAKWKEHPVTIGKRPCVFLILA